MRLLLSVVLVVSMDLVQAQPQSDTVRIPLGDRIIAGTEVDFGFRTILGKALELVVTPRSFNQNWPFYGYAIPQNPNTDPCHDLSEEYSNLAIGRTAIVLSRSNSTNRRLLEYIGFPVQDVTNSGTGSSDVSDWMRSGFRARDLCDWLDDPSVLATVMQEIVPLSYGFPDGDWNRIDPIPDNSVPVMSGTIIQGTEPTANIFNISWTRMGDGQMDSEELAWVPILNYADTDPVPIGATWQFRAGDENSGNNTSDYFLTLNQDLNPCSDECRISWSSGGGGEMNLVGVSGNEDLSNYSFTMWYLPRAEDGGLLIPPNSYVLTEEPLPALDTDIRIAAHPVRFSD